MIPLLIGPMPTMPLLPMLLIAGIGGGALLLVLAAAVWPPKCRGYRPARGTPNPKLPQGGSGTAPVTDVTTTAEAYRRYVITETLKPFTVDVDAKRLALNIGTLSVDLNAAGVGTVTCDGKPMPVRSISINVQAGKLVNVQLGIVPRPLPTRCVKGPEGWRCTRHVGHDGPCAAVPDRSAS